MPLSAVSGPGTGAVPATGSGMPLQLPPLSSSHQLAPGEPDPFVNLVDSNARVPLLPSSGSLANQLQMVQVKSEAQLMPMDGIVSSAGNNAGVAQQQQQQVRRAQQQGGVVQQRHQQWHIPVRRDCQLRSGRDGWSVIGDSAHFSMTQLLGGVLAQGRPVRQGSGSMLAGDLTNYG